MKTLQQIREELKVGEKEGDDVEFKKTTGGKPSQPEKKNKMKIAKKKKKSDEKDEKGKAKPLGFYMGKTGARGKTATGSTPHEIDCEPSISTPEDKAAKKADKKKK
jgi:hypothetical protein